MRTRAWARPNLAIGALLTGILALVAGLSVFWTPFDPEAMSSLRLAGPSLGHWLGTDWAGRDVGSRIMAGARNSIAVGVVAVAIGLLAGVTLGAVAAARRDWLDDLVMRFSDVIFAFPAIVSALLITTLLGAGAVNAIIAIGIFNIPVFARVTRGAALQIWSQDYVRAGLAMGKGRLALTRDHVLPNIAPALIVQATIQFGLAILAEAGLSFLGVGTQPPHPSWGQMLFDSQTMFSLAPTLAIFPGLAILLAVFGLNMLGDGLRDILDPRLTIARAG